jgi:biotin carboxylase
MESSPMLNLRRPNGHSEPNGRSRVLVVGTTTDYVDLLRRGHPEECLFLTKLRLRLHAKEPRPADGEEVLYRGNRQLHAIELLRRHQYRYGIKVVGVVCFDCESMPLASFMAKRLGLPYPSSKAVKCCRNKRLMKQHWRAGGTSNPRFSIVQRSEEAVEFLQQIGGPCVLKPLSGSGSELVFRVENSAECRLRFEKIISNLKSRRTAPLYQFCKEGRGSILMEEWIDGEEFSCDFLVETDRVRVIRLTRKYLRHNGPPGTVEAYELSPNLPDACRESRLTPLLLRAASTLGIDYGICMADFIVRGGQPEFLELTPRCGGDCLPSLLKTACNFDMLGMAIRFARTTVDNAMVLVNESTVALRLFADRPGTLEGMDTAALAADRRVLSAVLTRRSGDEIRLPPLDYDSWILGHVIYRPVPGRAVSEQNDELKSLFHFEIAET